MFNRIIWNIWASNKVYICVQVCVAEHLFSSSSSYFRSLNFFYDLLGKPDPSVEYSNIYDGVVLLMKA